MSLYVGISSKDGYAYRHNLEVLLKDCPVVEKSIHGGGAFLLAGEKYGFTVDWAEVTEQELYLHLKAAWSEEAIELFKQLFDWLCENTTWDLELDWEETQDTATGQSRKDIYRPSKMMTT